MIGYKRIRAQHKGQVMKRRRRERATVTIIMTPYETTLSPFPPSLSSLPFLPLSLSQMAQLEVKHRNEMLALGKTQERELDQLRASYEKDLDRLRVSHKAEFDKRVRIRILFINYSCHSYCFAIIIIIYVLQSCPIIIFPFPSFFSAPLLLSPSPAKTRIIR